MSLRPTIKDVAAAAGVSIKTDSRVLNEHPYVRADTKLRVDEAAITFVRDFVASGKPVASICHGPWTLLEAGVVSGRTLTSFPSIRTDLRNAGATVVDQEVATDDNLITSRSPDDLPAFCETIVQTLTRAGASVGDAR